MKALLALLICGTVLSQNVQAEDFAGIVQLKGDTLQDATFKGIVNLTNVKADSLDITGPLGFNNLEVKNDTTIVGPVEKSKEGKFNNLKVTGPFETENVTCTNLDVTGSVTATNLKVEKDATVTGGFELNKSSLNNLTITSDNIVLKNTEVSGNIVVKKESGVLGKIKNQELRLEGKTTVKGTVTFESGEGKIVQASEAKIEGAVTGATVEKK